MSDRNAVTTPTDWDDFQLLSRAVLSLWFKSGSRLEPQNAYFGHRGTASDHWPWLIWLIGPVPVGSCTQHQQKQGRQARSCLWLLRPQAVSLTPTQTLSSDAHAGICTPPHTNSSVIHWPPREVTERSGQGALTIGCSTGGPDL